LPKKPKPILVTQGVRRQQDAVFCWSQVLSLFGGEETNSSELVARALHGQVIGGLAVVSVVLPCVFATAPGALQQALEQWQPRLVLALGQAAGRNELSLERVAINVMDAP
jgi:pyroglutamyl-peptidase